ncbi:DUF4123 domain-containing protein [Aquincola sp. MAHUQ-54]|uniref:DUF4123 domain-containing protein n=1 Tax=Aquincola agrisoli TaxID=3119538 RepID=A0AAW9QBR5_9BURK
MAPPLYFAQDPLAEGFADQVLADHGRLNQDRPGLPLLAVVNAAADDGLAAHLEAQAIPFRGVFDEGPFQRLAQAGPLLVLPPAAAGAARQLVRRLRDKPALSFIACAADAEAIRTQWCQAMQVAADDEPGARYLLNLADTRCLPDGLALLAAVAGPTLLPAPGRIWYPARDGLLRWADVEGTPADAPVRPLDAARWGALLEAGEADLLLSQVHLHRPELLQSRRPSELYHAVQCWLWRQPKPRDDVPALVAECIGWLASGAPA